MGIPLSLPLLGLPALATTAVSWAVSCCGAAACTTLCAACGKCSSSLATRLAYAVIFLANSILAWLMLTPWVLEKLEQYTHTAEGVKCFGAQCTGFVAVQRICLALGVFHAIIGSAVVGVRSTTHPRAAIQSGFWGPKVIMWLVLVGLSFAVPDGVFVFWGNYIAVIGAFLFILYGLVLLVDFAHSWAEMCINKIETHDSRFWKTTLVGSTLGMYAAAIAMTVVMYVFFGRNGCSMNQAAITINLLLCAAVSAVSINPEVQEYNPQAGLAQAAVVTVYCTYLVLSAVTGEPDDRLCNPLVRSRGTRTASVVLGALFTFLAIAYTSLRAGSRRSAEDDYREGYEPVASDVVTTEPSRASMRIEAIRAAVDSGSLPASALYELDEDEEDEVATQTSYDYSVFHFIFFLATQWTATLLTTQVDKDDTAGFVPVGRTYFYSWVKIASTYVCLALYTWTLVAPIVMRDRFGN
ncbi:serine incorporator/TMS membrane protein [Dipodascopsis tothii]|uniref:serine incorporator/TMS membrane protein n=1 Tax=Dipodascopsis tothii TaxID=44089 RepID=UPI0034CD67D1